jgi:MOSC domain-containing protein YiiM
MKLLSISSGKVTPLFGNHHPDYKSVPSAIRKTNISNLENGIKIQINNLGIQGDEQADLSVHAR